MKMKMANPKEVEPDQYDIPELYTDIIEPAGSQLLLDSEARELEEDMKKAARTLRYFGKYFKCNVYKSALCSLLTFQS